VSQIPITCGLEQPKWMVSFGPREAHGEWWWWCSQSALEYAGL